MSRDVAVVDPLPIFRHGLSTLLTEAGFHVEAPADVMHWVACRQACLILLTLAVPADWVMLAELAAAHPVCPVLALIADDSVETGARAVRVGARSVMPRDASAELLRRTVAATADGQAVLPAAVLRALVGRDAARPSTGPVLSPEQISWLRDLAAGHTVARLAADVGYSERAMFRMLRLLYQRLGVQTRMEAIIRAGELGWLKSGPGGGHSKG